MARSFGVRGLDVTIVWHPGWPILHPLSEADQLALLWPHPTVIDFDRLPEVHPSEFAFVVGHGTRIMTDAQFEEATKTPLSVITDPFARFFGIPTYHA